MQKEPMSIFQRLGIVVIVVVLIAAMCTNCFPTAAASWDYRFEIVTSESVGQKKWAYVIADTTTGTEYLIIESARGIGVTAMPTVEN